MESDLGYGMSAPSVGDGGFYTQITYTGGASQKLYWINLSGEKKLALDLSQLSESGVNPADLYIQDYAADAQSGVDALVTWQDKERVVNSAIVRFDSGGDFSRFIPLKIDFRPTRFAAFLSGNWLLTGYPSDGEKGKSTLPLAIVDSDGNLVSINSSGTGLLGPFQLPFSAPKTSSDSDQSTGTNLDAQFIASTLLMSGGRDGYVYMYDPVLSDSIYKVASDGSSSKIAVRIPALPDGEKLRPWGIYSAHDQVALEEAVVSKDQGETGVIRIKRCILLVFDTTNGSEVGAYSADAKFGHMLVGFAPESFYFMSFRPQPDHRVDHYIVHATP